MAHLQYMPGDPRLVDQLVYELKSKGIFDQFRKDCIADVDTRPAYQNLRQRVESSVSTFLSRQCWKPDLNKNQLREKLRKHILDGNYLEQGVERIVDQVVNPKVASVFIPQVEDLVYNYLGITRKKAPETSDVSNLLPTDLEAVSPGSVKSIDKDDQMDTEDIDVEKMEIDEEEKPELKEECKVENNEKEEQVETNVAAEQQDGNEEKNDIPHSAESIKLEDIPAPDNSPPNLEDHLKSVPLPKDVALTDIPLPEDGANKSLYFKPLPLPSEDSNSSSDSSLRRNMSPLTPIRNYTNENSCDAQQAFDNDSDGKNEEKKEPSSFRFAIESSEVKVEKTPETKTEKKEDPELAYQFNRVNINSFNTPLYDDSSNSNNLRIDYESDTNSKMIEAKQEIECSEEAKKEKKVDDKKNHKSSHRSRDSHRHSNSKDKRSESKQSSSRDSSRHDKKSSSTRDDHKKSSKESRDRSKDRSDRKDSRDSSKHRSSSSSHRSSSHRDSKSHRSSSSSHKHSSSRSSDVKKSSSSSNRDKERSSDNKDKSSRDKDRKDSRSSSHRSDKDRKSSSSSKKSDGKDKKKDKKETDDHYSSSGRGNNGRRSTDRDSNDGSSSSKGSHNQNGAKTSDSKKESKNSSSKSDNTSPSGDSTSPSDKDQKPQDNSKPTQFKPVRVENLETPIANPPRLPFVPDVTLKKPKFAANFEEAKKMMKMRKFLDDEQKRMNQEAALLLEFQANVRPSLSQVYSSIPGPELEFVCGSNTLIANPACEITNTDPDADNFAVPQVITERPRTESLKRKRSISESVPNSDEKNKNVEETVEYIEKNMMETDDADDNNKITYDENKPFSLLVEEISEYSKASENKVKDKADIGSPNQDDSGEVCEIDDTISDTKDTEIIDECANVTISSTEEEILGIPDDKSEVIEQEIPNIQTIETTAESDNVTRNFEITESIDETELEKEIIEPPKYELKYFSNEEISTAETQINEFDKFFKNYMEQITNNKLYLINCDSYEENIMKEVAISFGDYEIVNYLKNGHLRLPNTSKNIVKDVPLCEEVSLPIENIDYAKSPVFSPTKSECSFDLSSDYDAKLSEIVNKKSRQEVLEIILGSVIDMDSETSVIDYDESSDSNKRKFEDEGVVNNNRSVLTPTKIRKLSDSDQISSTTEDKDEVSNNNKQQNVTRSKYLGKAKRVGLPRPKRCNLVNSPSSDKSVENYVQNTQSPSPQPPNGKLKNAPRTKVQRYDTSDLYKPKLHYLSRRNVS